MKKIEGILLHTYKPYVYVLRQSECTSSTITKPSSCKGVISLISCEFIIVRFYGHIHETFSVDRIDIHIYRECTAEIY